MSRRRWTHRRLGLGATRPTDQAMSDTDLLLAAVGARRTPTAGRIGDAFDAALFDFVCDIDLTVDLPALESTAIPMNELPAALPARTMRQRLTSRVLFPVAMTGVAAVAIAVTAVLTGTSSPTSPALAATAESRQLLTHADKLLTAASHAEANDRTGLVTEAKTDLSHVSRLLPLTAPQSRSEIRERLAALDRRAAPLVAKQPSRTADADPDDTSDADMSDAGRPAATGGAASGDPTTTQHAPKPQPTSATGQPPAGGATQDTTYRQPMSGAGPPRRP